MSSSVGALAEYNYRRICARSLAVNLRQAAPRLQEIIRVAVSTLSQLAYSIPYSAISHSVMVALMHAMVLWPLIRMPEFSVRNLCTFLTYFAWGTLFFAVTMFSGQKLQTGSSGLTKSERFVCVYHPFTFPSAQPTFT
jgi:hypothetical protein